MDDFIMNEVKRQIENKNSQLDMFIEKYVRLNAKPLIKGEITANKLKYRGIKLNVYIGKNGAFEKEYELTQRGEVISPRLIQNF